MSKPGPEITKWYFLGCVDYAQHNFARLRPLLYSENGRRWDGMADRAWFPNEGLVFTVQADLRYAPAGALWVFRVVPNPRGEAVDKDLYSAIQSKPAVELIIDMEPSPAEDLRRLVMDEGIPAGVGGRTGVALPELNDRWVMLGEVRRDEEGRIRPAPSTNVKHLKVLVGTPEELCGLPTPGGQFVLPPITGGGSETRNWLPPGQFLETLAADLQRWAPHGAHKTKARAAAQALRELAPLMSAIAALKADDAKVAMIRASGLVDAAESITGAAETILGLIAEQEPFKSAIERRRAEIHAELEDEALAAVEQKEGAARDRLLAEQTALLREIEEATALLETRKTELRAIESETETIASMRAEHIGALETQVDALLQRAASEPARLLADWLGVSGFVVGGTSGESTPSPPMEAGWMAPVESEIGRAVPIISAGELGPALFAASPAASPGHPRLLLIDAALRARELPLLIGANAREFAEAWFAIAGGEAPPVLLPDPTLLSLIELLPAGPREHRAPLSVAFRLARSRTDAVVVLIDDLDPAAAGFWLPELARCQRHPDRYGFPQNLLFMAVVEAEPDQMGLSGLRAGELFPLTFADCDPPEAAPIRPAEPRGLSMSLVQDPTASTSWPARVEAMERSLLATFRPEDARSLAADLAEFLRHLKGGGPRPRGDGTLAALLTESAQLLRRDGSGGN